MELLHPQQHKKKNPLEPSLWIDEPVDDAISLLENALRGDEPASCADGHADEVQPLLEENTRLRELLAQLSEIIGSNVGSAR